MSSVFTFAWTTPVLSSLQVRHQGSLVLPLEDYAVALSPRARFDRLQPVETALKPCHRVVAGCRPVICWRLQNQVPVRYHNIKRGIETTTRAIVMYFCFSVMLGMNSTHGNQMSAINVTCIASGLPLKKPTRP